MPLGLPLDTTALPPTRNGVAVLVDILTGQGFQDRGTHVMAVAFDVHTGIPQRAASIGSPANASATRVGEAASGGGLRTLDNAGVVLFGAALMPFFGAYGGSKLGQHLLGHGTAGNLAAVAMGGAGFIAGGALSWYTLKYAW